MFVDPHQPFLWGMYILILLVYSALALGFRWKGDKSPILSARNVTPMRRIVVVHLLFLGLVFDLLLYATHLSLAAGQTLPAWLSEPFWGRHMSFSPIDCALIAVCYLLASIEQRFIYTDAKRGGHDLPDENDFY
jgi:hypothetical protein